MLSVKVRNLYNPDHDKIFGGLFLNPSTAVYPPPGSPPKPDATSGWDGAQLNLAQIPAGEHTLWVVPKQASADPVGVLTGTTLIANRIYRGLRIQLTTAGGKMTGAFVHSSTVDNGTVEANVKAQELKVLVRAVWMKSGKDWSRNNKPIDMVMVHTTGGPEIGSSMHTFLSGASPHYLVTRDGHVIKFTLEEKNSGHAAPESTYKNTSAYSYWGTQGKLGERSIGIENVGSPEQGLTDPQYKALISLIKELMDKFKIPRHRVIGHSECLTDGAKKLSNLRVACPGWKFDWPRLEGEGIGLRRDGGSTKGSDPVAAFFDATQAAGIANLQIKPGDYDPQQAGKQIVPGKFGGEIRQGISDKPITQLQTWLAEIGYSVGPMNGKFNTEDHTFRAFLHFLVHFMNKKPNTAPVIDRQAAALIHAVRHGNPPAA